jgi:hypothetical protein
MKLAVPYIEICDVPEELVSGVLGAIAEEDWHTSDYRKGFPNLGACDSVLLRHSPLCGDRNCQTNDRAIADIKNQPLYEKFASVFEPFLELLREHYIFNEYAAFVARMPAHSEVGMHFDSGNFLTKCHRIHFPLQTNPKVAYCIEDQEYYWQRGKAYEFDNTRLHGVKNRSDENRIHIVVNLYNLEGHS